MVSFFYVSGLLPVCYKTLFTSLPGWKMNKTNLKPWSLVSSIPTGNYLANIQDMRYNISCNNLCFFTYTTFCTSYLFLDSLSLKTIPSFSTYITLNYFICISIKYWRDIVLSHAFYSCFSLQAFLL